MASLISSQCHVAAMPHPGRGHINAMMNLCRLLSSHNDGFLISFVVTEEWLSILSSDPSPPSNVKYRTIPNCIPSERGRAADMNGFLEAVQTEMEVPFEHLLDQLDPPVKAIVGDTFLPWVVKVGNRRHVPVCSLFPMAACMFSALNNYELLPVPKAVNGGFPAQDILSEYNDHPLEKYIPGLHPLKSRDLNTVYTVKPINKILQSFPWIQKAQYLIFTSFYELESNLFDSLKSQIPCQIYPIGPCIPYNSPKKEETKLNEGYYITWLDSQSEKSVLYVSLGSFLSVSPAQSDEIANGLASSGFKFLWVVRDNDSRVQEMVGKTGLIVPWCEQLKVMCHPSIGGFLTHCGWNSTLEAVYAGVPMLTFPIFWDQDVDSRLIVEKWNIGLSLKDEMRKDGIVGREEIEKNVRKLMDLGGDVSKKLRNESFKLKEVARKAIEKGGSSYNNLNSFVEGILSSK
ncbi:hypothetical protein LUZ60_011149 [Juncus effusus]|nr:hypothetical protein LUZ60_011149 [Juncus effusus]